jgi:hypothetical protein
MRSLWRIRRIRLYVYTAVGCIAVTAGSGIYAAVHLALAGPLPLPVESIKPPRDSGPLPTLTGPSARSRIDPTLSRVASDLGGRQVEVRCWAPPAWMRLMEERAAYYGEPVTVLFGYASGDERRIHLPSFFCDAVLVVGDTTVDRSVRAQAAEVFAHELEHLRGAETEAEAECDSYQSLASVAQALGADRGEARKLARAAWRRLYDPDDPEYGSAECRDGGALDRHPHSSEWP